MGQKETVRYTIKDYKFREITEGSGVINYQLVDEYGNNRIVAVMAKLNRRKQVSFIQPIHRRETLLIEALAKASLNETITVDFSKFNKKYLRGSIRSKKISVKNIKVKSKDAQSITSISSMVDNKVRLTQLVAVTIAGFAAVILIMENI